VLHLYIHYGFYSLYYYVLISIVACHALRPPHHFVCYIIVRQQDWRRPVSLVVFGYLRTRFLGESLVYILRENSGRTEESIGYWGTCGVFGLFIRALIDLTF
jgi:hypothetical protein